LTQKTGSRRVFLHTGTFSSKPHDIQKQIILLMRSTLQIRS